MDKWIVGKDKTPELRKTSGVKKLLED